MEKCEKMPTARACDIFSLAAVVAGVCAALFFLMSRPLNMKSVALGFLILFGFMAIAVIVRILGIIGQNLFDINKKTGNTEMILRGFQEQADQRGSRIQGVFDQVNCDVKDIHVYLRDIKAFFEQIERHLNLKK